MLYILMKALHEGLPDMVNKGARQMAIINVNILLSIVFRTVHPTTIGASDQDHPMSTGGGRIEVERKEKIFSGTYY